MAMHPPKPHVPPTSISSCRDTLATDPMKAKRPGYRRILVPLDGSSLSERAIPFAEALARASQTQVILIRVSPIGDSHDPSGDTRYLDTIATQLREHDLKVATVSRCGEPAAVIAEEATRRDVDLIIMGMSGRGLLGRGAGSSVAECLLEQLPVPVLLVRDWHGDDARRRFAPGAVVILPLDGSAIAEEALPGASAIAAAIGGELLLLHVDRSPLPWAEYGPETERDAAKDATSRHEWREYLQRIARTLMAGGVVSRVEICSGDAASEIAAAIRRYDAAVVIVATHGQTGSARATMGNVARSVLWSGTAPTMLVRPAAMRAHDPARTPLPRSQAQLSGDEHGTVADA
jgi:nucleotide-binding universal stress UspA family protein